MQQRQNSNPSSTTKVHLTDGLPELIPLLKQNIDLNLGDDPEQSVFIEADLLSWGEPVNLTPPQVILAADCAYLEESFPLLTRTLQSLMGDDTVLWFCYKKRRKRDKDCIKMIAKVCNVRRVDGSWEASGVFLFEVKRKPSATPQPQALKLAST